MSPRSAWLCERTRARLLAPSRGAPSPLGASSEPSAARSHTHRPGAATAASPTRQATRAANGRGYWLVANDGGIFSFEAPFYGSMGHVRLNRPVTGMVRSNEGYLMVGEDGGIFTFGNAVFRGSLGATPPAQPIVAVTPFGR